MNKELSALLKTINEAMREVDHLRLVRDGLVQEDTDNQARLEDFRIRHRAARRTCDAYRACGDPRTEEKAQEESDIKKEFEQVEARVKFIAMQELPLAGIALGAAENRLKGQLRNAWDLACMIELDSPSDRTARQTLVRAAICSQQGIEEFCQRLGLDLAMPESHRKELRSKLASEYAIPEVNG